MSEPHFFEAPAQFRDWLSAHHDSEIEVFLGYYKKHTGRPTIAWSDAVDQALCFGWIDGQVRRIDDERHMQRFTPRKHGSIWSAINVEKVARLTAEGLMEPAGIAAFEARSEGRTAVYSYEREHPAELPPAYLERFRACAEAWEWFEGQAPWYRRTAIHKVVSAKRESTRERRLAELIDCSAQQLRIPSLRVNKPTDD